MERRGMITGVWAVDTVLYVFAKVVAGLFVASSVAGLLAALVPGGMITATIVMAVPYAALAYYAYDNWPPWLPKESYRFDDEIEFDPRSDRHGDPDKITIDDVVTVLDMLEIDPERYPRKLLKDMSIVLFYGTMAEEDASRVLAQFERVTGVSGEAAKDEAFGRLFALLAAADADLPTRAFERLRHLGRKALLASFGGDADIEHTGSEEYVKSLTAKAIYHFSREYRPHGYEAELLDMLDSEYEHVRASGAYALGTIGRGDPDRADQVTRKLISLTDDREKMVRRAATYGLVGPAFHVEEARSKLEELATGRDPDLRDIATECLEALEDNRMDAMEEPQEEDGKKRIQIGEA